MRERDESLLDEDTIEHPDSRPDTHPTASGMQSAVPSINR